MNYFVFFFIGLFTLVFQASLIPFFPGWLGHPDFLFILVLFVAFKFDWIGGLILVFLFGWMTDVAACIQPGIFPLQDIIVFSAVKLLSQNTFLKHPGYQIPLVGICYLLMRAAFYFGCSFVMQETLLLWEWKGVLRETCILLVASIPLFLIFNALFEYFSTKRLAYRVVRRDKKGGNHFR